MMRLLPLFLCSVLAAGCGADVDTVDQATAAPDPPATDESGSPIVEVASAEALVDDLDGLEDETVVLNFWATWCGPCRLEFPEFIQYDKEMEGEGVAVRFVSLDQPSDLSMVKAFLAEHDVEDPSYLYTGQGDMTRQLNPFVGGAIPITMILDGDRIVQHTHVGRLSYEELVETVATIQAGGDPDDAS